MKQYILARLAEASTWRGIMLIVSAMGWYEFSESQKDAIEALGVGIFGIAHFTPDSIFNVFKKS